MRCSVENTQVKTYGKQLPQCLGGRGVLYFPPPPSRIRSHWQSLSIIIVVVPVTCCVGKNKKSLSFRVLRRFSVAQLVKAFDTHQEVVTKRSLKVTTNPVTKNTTAAVPAADDGCGKDEDDRLFPTGPNALRLFIPNIDICGGSAAAAKRTRGEAGGRDDESARSPNSDDCRKRSNVN